MRLVMIDNYDSFTYNLVQLFYEFDLEVLVFRHDAVTLAQIEALQPHWICISPGPKAPAQAGISKAVIFRFYQKIPILGVCLGHQAINEVFGGATVKARCRCTANATRSSITAGAYLPGSPPLSPRPGTTPWRRPPALRNWKSPPGPKTA